MHLSAICSGWNTESDFDEKINISHLKTVAVASQ